MELVQGDTQLVTTPVCSYFWRGEYLDSVDYLDQDCQDTPGKILRDELSGRLQQLGEDTSWRRWQAFHLSRWHAFSLIEDVGF
jgi:hypothetical protein